ncbi:hypothetical protein [Roseivirga sp. E12]|uniref:hypothetical protein n=1 Tax=Roseivirga sp. E12 TaxID=2819237 RepID=UPI001ABC5506|nr:hypothetical protein [Roseivirga sp. E12]MBO3697234.1 hypothetical protein [Roseivirga sp. E12]
MEPSEMKNLVLQLGRPLSADRRGIAKKSRDSFLLKNGVRMTANKKNVIAA